MSYNTKSEAARMFRNMEKEIAANAERSKYINDLVAQRWADYLVTLPFDEQQQIADEKNTLAKLKNTTDTFDKYSAIYGFFAFVVFVFCSTQIGPMVIHSLLFEKLGMTFSQSMMFYGVPFLFLICMSIYYARKKKKNRDKIYDIRNNGLCTKRENELKNQIENETSTRLACSPWHGSPYMYEQETAKYFRKIGYTQVSVTPGSGDFGADVLATSPNGKRVAIQCKQYSSLVGQAPLQQVLGGMQYYHCELGYVVTSTGYTKAAIELAKQSGIKLFISNDLSWGLDEVFDSNGNVQHTSVSISRPIPTSTRKNNSPPVYGSLTQTQTTISTQSRIPVSSNNELMKISNYNFIWEDTPDSYCFSRIAYDSTRRVLGVTFRASGATYVYMNFSYADWTKFKNAPSNGTWYKENIKGKYEYRLING